jgi:cell volume regulation protein A
VTRGQRIPRWARPSLVVRDGRSTKFQDAGRLMAGDHVYIFVPDRYPRLLDRLFASPTEVGPEDAEFFGAFAVDPARPASDIESAYAPGLTEEEAGLTIGALVVSRLGGRAEYADRVTLGPIELIVRDVDDKGRVTSIGVSLDPAPPPRAIPVFLGAREIRDRLRGLFRRQKVKDDDEAAPSPDDDQDTYNSRGFDGAA